MHCSLAFSHWSKWYGKMFILILMLFSSSLMFVPLGTPASVTCLFPYGSCCKRTNSQAELKMPRFVRWSKKLPPSFKQSYGTRFWIFCSDNPKETHSRYFYFFLIHWWYRFENFLFCEILLMSSMSALFDTCWILLINLNLIK